MLPENLPEKPAGQVQEQVQAETQEEVHLQSAWRHTSGCSASHGPVVHASIRYLGVRAEAFVSEIDFLADGNLAEQSVQDRCAPHAVDRCAGFAETLHRVCMMRLSATALPFSETPIGHHCPVQPPLGFEDGEFRHVCFWVGQRGKTVGNTSRVLGHGFLHLSVGVDSGQPELSIPRGKRAGKIR